MNPSNPFPHYRGMQVHAVPDSDKAYDTATGRKLPWAYDTANPRNDAVEKGPFGRGTNRRTRSTLSRSRSKTAEPRREEDRVRAEQLAAEDAVFGGLRRVPREGGMGEEGEQKVVAKSRVPAQEDGTEVILYGFGVEVQWAAIDFYERVSCGEILEDYERDPSGKTSLLGRLGRHRTALEDSSPTPGLDKPGYSKKPKTYSRAALKKKNTYAGGQHWIKVTFDTKEAAELACARSPHVCRGYLVYAEPYEQHGPGRDEAIPATQAGAQITGERVPFTFSTKEPRPVDTSPGGSSTTATSATATAPRAGGGSQTSSSHTLDDIFRPRSAREQGAIPRTPTTPRPAENEMQLQQQQQPGQGTMRRRRISGAKLAEVHPASMALAPKKPVQSWSAWLLGTGDVIGSTVPKREDGSFDWERAGFYWRLFYWLDGLLGTDFCGLKAD